MGKQKLIIERLLVSELQRIADLNDRTDINCHATHEMMTKEIKDLIDEIKNGALKWKN